MTILLWVIVFAVSLAVLIKASDYFTDAAEKIGIFFGIPAFIVGVTIVAFGTSLPELVSSIIAVLKDSSEIVVGNVVGSNITNIFLVLGFSAIFASKKIKVSYELIHVDLPILVGSAFLLTATIWDGVFSFGEAIICLIGIVVYIFYSIKSDSEQDGEKEKAEKKKSRKLEPKTIITLIVSAFFIFLGAKYTIDSVIVLSEILNIAKEIIAVGAVALGTSLPELVVSITAARKGNPEMAVGNVLGSNIFNTFVVMGIPAFIGTLIIPASILTFALPMMLIATLLYFFITQDKEITRWEGMLLVLFYIFFVGKLFSIL